MSLVVSGCKTVDEYIEEVPLTEFRVPHFVESKVIDGEVWYKGACSVRTITDKRTLASVRDHVGGLGECNGVWGLTPIEFAKTRTWMSELK